MKRIIVLLSITIQLSAAAVGLAQDASPAQPISADTAEALMLVSEISSPDFRAERGDLSPDGSWVAILLRDAAADDALVVKVFEADATELVWTYSAGPDAELTDVSFTPDGAEVAVASADGTLQFVDAATGDSTRAYSAETEIEFIEFSAAGDLVTLSTSSGFIVLDTQSLEVISQYDDLFGIEAMKLSPDGQYVGLSQYYEIAHRINLTAPETDPQFVEVTDTTLSDFAFNGDGSQISGVYWYFDSNNNVVDALFTWDFATSETVLSADRSETIGTMHNIEYSVDGSVLVVIENFSVLLIDSASGAVRTEIETPLVTQLLDLDLSADGTRLVAVGGEGAVIFGVQ